MTEDQRERLRLFVLREIKLDEQAIANRVMLRLMAEEKKFIHGTTMSATKRFMVMLEDEGVAKWRFDTRDDAQTFLDYMITKGVNGVIYESLP